MAEGEAPRTEDSAAPRVEHACERCGATSVTRDAWAEWDVPAQAWVLSEIFDFAFCHQCHSHTKLVKREAGSPGG